MTLYSHWRQVPDRVWDIIPNFYPSSDKMMSSPDTGAIRVHLPSYNALQQYRNLSGPTRLLSGYRSPVYNARVGGGALSQHKEAIAWDVDVTMHHYLDAVEAARQAGFTGLGYYPSRGFLHMDMGRPRFWWGTRKDKLIWEGLTGDK